MRFPALWGIGGVVALLANAIYRLTPYALELAELSLSVVEILALVAWVALNAYSEGYRGFQRMFSPRVVARARALDADPQPWLVVVAPLYCMGLVYATRKRLIISWVLTLAIIAIVVVVRRLDQPWRGIIDAGVVVGLAWGAISIVYFAARSFAGHAMPVPPDLPAPTPQPDRL